MYRTYTLNKEFWLPSHLFIVLRISVRDTATNNLVDISLFLWSGFSIASLSDIAENLAKDDADTHRYETTGNNSKQFRPTILTENSVIIRIQQVAK